LESTYVKIIIGSNRSLNGGKDIMIHYFNYLIFFKSEIVE